MEQKHRKIIARLNEMWSTWDALCQLLEIHFSSTPAPGSLLHLIQVSAPKPPLQRRLPDHTYLNTLHLFPSLFWGPSCFISNWNTMKHLFTEIFIFLSVWLVSPFPQSQGLWALFYLRALERCLIDSTWSRRHLLIEYTVNVKWCPSSSEVVMIHLSKGAQMISTEFCREQRSSSGVRESDINISPNFYTL